MTLFNYWHYIALILILSLFGAGVFFAYKQHNKKIRFQIIFSFFLISMPIIAFSIYTIDKYTKIAKIYKLENKRILSLEKIMYSGFVKNEGSHEIGKVTLEIKMVNRGMSVSNVKPGTFFSPRGFFEFLASDYSKGSEQNKPQQITREYTIAENLKPNETREFRVYFDYPGYFKDVSEFTSVKAH